MLHTYEDINGRSSSNGSVVNRRDSGSDGGSSIDGDIADVSCDFLRKRRFASEFDHSVNSEEEHPIPLTVNITSSSTTSFTGYETCVRVAKSRYMWFFVRRYADFFSLRQKLTSKYPVLRSKNIPFPSKRFWGGQSKEVVNSRIIGLSLYLNNVVETLGANIVKDPDLAIFLSPPMIVMTRAGYTPANGIYVYVSGNSNFGAYVHAASLSLSSTGSAGNFIETRSLLYHIIRMYVTTKHCIRVP